MKILLINLDSQKEILLITPIIRTLKTSNDADIHFLTKSTNKFILQENPYISKVHELDSSSNMLKKEKFDLVIDFESTFKSRLIAFRLNKKVYSFKKFGLKNWLYINFKLGTPPKRHVVERFFEKLKPLKIEEDNLGLDFYIPEKDEVENSWLPETHQFGYAAVCIGANYSTRKLPINRLIELCDRINKPIVLVGTDDDIQVANEIADFFKHGTDAEEKEIEELNKKTVIFNACGKFNFNQSASLIKHANWIFTYDNIMMHVAAALKKQIFSIWGNTIPQFGEYPYRTKFTIFENTKISCRPCSKTGFSKCPKGHFKCMNNVTFDFYLPD